jgi:succinate-semialdehyde dehydrogenase / glutarate-semialdehyde dehydrogenase
MPFTTVDPVTGQQKNTFEFCSEDMLDQSLQSLHFSFRQWKLLSVQDRQQVLARLVVRMREARQKLALLMTQEMGKPIKSSFAEVDKCISTIERAQKDDLSFLNSRKIKSPYAESLVYNEPLGVIYSVMPWNFPLWQVVRMFVPSLLAGNTVLLKHSELTPLLAQAIHDLFEGVWTHPILQHLYISHQQTDRIMKDDRIGGVSLTGSVRAGHEIYKAAATYFKKAVLELGGSDPYLVLQDADLELAAKKITKSRLNNNGQTCISAKRAIVHTSVIEKFTELLKVEFDQYKFGDPSLESTDLGPLAHPKFKIALADQLESFKKNTDAVRVYCKPHGQANAASAFVDAEIYRLSQNSEWLKDQEFFAPVLILIPFENENEAVSIANATIFGLAAGIFSRDIERAQQLAAQIVVGQVSVNDIISTDLSMPFGGFKSSGIGREMGHEAYFEFTETKVISHS